MVPQLKLTATLISVIEPMVIVNDQLLGVGEEIEGMRLSLVDEGRAVFHFRGKAYEFTIDDPTTFTDRITVKTNMSLLGAPMYEFACHEGNYALENMLRAARIVEQQ